MDELLATRRDAMAASLLTAAAGLLWPTQASAKGVDPTMTIIRPPDDLKWTSQAGAPPKIVEAAELWGKSSEPGLYYTLIRWYPGYMSAPHWYETDRLCVVVSGTWWCASGEDFDPQSTVAAPAGSFVRRVARTPHYDGVRSDGKEPAVIAICGMGPIHLHLTDPHRPLWRQV